MEEEGVKGGHKCGRWNPTPEQVKVLTELFRSGLRTPSTDQIQKISSHLSSFGKIESKNVFYWFQNHKARERHHIHTNKKRRRLLQHHPHDPKPSTTSTTTTTSICAPRTNLFMPCAIGDEQEYREVETLELFPLSSSGGSEAAASVMKSNNCHYGWFEAAPTAALFSSCTVGGNNRDYLPLDLRLSSL